MKKEITRTGNSATTRHFSTLLSPTRRGARVARQLAVAQLRSWDAPFETAAYVVAELSANAVQHGRVPGRGFRLALALMAAPAGGGPAGGATLRIEVTDARAERLPDTHRHAPGPDDESGRGLLLVGALADRWGVIVGPVPGKTVWAELDLASVPAPAALGQPLE